MDIPLVKFLADIQQASEHPMLDKWIYGVKQDHRAMLDRIIALDKYPELIPESMKERYQAIRVECLEKTKIWPG